MCFAIPFTFEESLKRISENPVSATAQLFSDMESDRANRYVNKCLRNFYKGHYGITPLEDIEANISALEEGEGRIVARYEHGDALRNDIYVIAFFSFENPEVDSNYTTILYCNEY